MSTNKILLVSLDFPAQHGVEVKSGDKMLQAACESLGLAPQRVISAWKTADLFIEVQI